MEDEESLEFSKIEIENRKKSLKTPKKDEAYKSIK